MSVKLKPKPKKKDLRAEKKEAIKSIKAKMNPKIKSASRKGW